MMRSIIFFALAVAASAIPSSLTPRSKLGQLALETIASDACKLPEPGANCAGAAMKDVIIVYGTATQDQKEVIIGAAKSSGASIINDYSGFG
jgi:hypothetical protein